MSSKQNYEFNKLKHLQVFSSIASELFCESDWKMLRSIREGIVKRNGMEFYREKKEAMSPSKRIMVNKLFRSRIHALDITTQEKIDRVGQKYLNRLVKSAFITLQKNYASENEIIAECKVEEE